jgi:CBS domain-containing protein
MPPPAKQPAASGASRNSASPAPARRSKTVGEIMSADLLMIEGQDRVATAAAVMDAARVGSALVMDHDTLVGIFTERDVRHALKRNPSAALESPVSKWMTRDPMTIGPDVTVRQALGKMLRGGFRHLPIVEHKHVVGIVSLRDLARTFAR